MLYYCHSYLKPYKVTNNDYLYKQVNNHISTTSSLLIIYKTIINKCIHVLTQSIYVSQHKLQIIVTFMFLIHDLLLL